MSRTIRFEFTRGAIDTIPLIVGAIPFGIIYGTLSQSSDLSVYGALALSSIVFAGSSQFVALGLIASGSSIFIIIITTFLINPSSFTLFFFFEPSRVTAVRSCSPSSR